MADFKHQLVLVGGKDDNTKGPSGQITVWDKQLEQWCNPYPPMKSPKVDPFAVGWNEYLIVAGIESGIEVLNSSKGGEPSWQNGGNPPVSILQSLVVHRGTLYIIGDGDRAFKTAISNVISFAESDSKSTLSWDSIVSTPFKESMLFSLSDSLFAVGGYSGDGGTSVKDILWLSEEENCWVKVVELPQACFNCCCTTLPSNKGLLVLGGQVHKTDSLLLKTVNVAFKSS